MPGQELIKLVGEFLLVTLTIGARASAHLDAARPHSVHEIPHIEFGPDIFPGVHFAAWTQDVTAFFDDLGGQRYIARNNQVSGAQSLDDFVVRNVEASRHLERADVLRRRCTQILIRHQGQLHTRPRCCTKQDVPGNDRTGSLA